MTTEASTDTVLVYEGVPSLGWKAIAHGSLMFIALGLATPVAAIMAAFTKVWTGGWGGVSGKTYCFCLWIASLAGLPKVTFALIGSMLLLYFMSPPVHLPPFCDCNVRQWEMEMRGCTLGEGHPDATFHFESLQTLAVSTAFSILKPFFDP